MVSDERLREIVKQAAETRYPSRLEVVENARELLTARAVVVAARAVDSMDYRDLAHAVTAHDAAVQGRPAGDGGN